MAGKVRRMPRPADPNIETVLDQFLEEQERRLKPRTFRNYADTVSLFKDYLNGYAHQSLSETEHAFFEKKYDEIGEDAFCVIFGPEKIAEELSPFLDDFMLRKVAAGESFFKAAGTVCRKLLKWLEKKGYVREEDAGDLKERVAGAARDVPRAEKAAHILYEYSMMMFFGLENVNPRNILEMDYYMIFRVEPGKLWLAPPVAGEKMIGPVEVPAEVTDLVEEGWTLSCTLVRKGRRWLIVETGNVYPL